MDWKSPPHLRIIPLIPAPYPLFPPCASLPQTPTCAADLFSVSRFAPVRLSAFFSQPFTVNRVSFLLVPFFPCLFHWVSFLEGPFCLLFSIFLTPAWCSFFCFFLIRLFPPRVSFPLNDDDSFFLFPQHRSQELSLPPSPCSDRWKRFLCVFSSHLSMEQFCASSF